MRHFRSPTTHEALLRAHKLKKPLVVWAVCASIIVSLLIGVAAGVASKSVNVGAEIAGSLIGVVSVFGGMLIRMAR
jgi:hypothetical protein